MNRFKGFNLSEWALKHRQMVYFLMIVLFAMGIISYNQLGRSEFPDFVIREMVVVTVWPGASAKEVEQQVTDKIEKKLQDTPNVDVIRSNSKPGQSVIYLRLKDTVMEKDVRPIWIEVRNIVNDMAGTLPQGVYPPMFNDRFGDVFGTIYALTSDGFTMEEVRQKAEQIRQTLLQVDAVGKVELIGVQREAIYIEVENTKLAQLGIDPALIAYSLRNQNSVDAAGMIETTTDNVNLRISGYFEDIDSIRNLMIRTNDRIFRLGDIATVERSYVEPSDPKMYYNGEPAIGLTVSMETGGNVLTLGEELDKTVAKIKRDLPVGLEIHKVADQPEVVKESINEFVDTLVEALVIVLVVCFISLGLRAGMIVALSIPMVVAALIVVMKLTGIQLHNISLGALIIALGLLVDDAIITIETMHVKLEQGMEKAKAASYSFTATAFPRLIGALVTCAGFMPVGFSTGSASEFVGSIFWVVTASLILSWLVAGTVTPLLGYKWLNFHKKEQDYDQVYNTPFYRAFRRILEWTLLRRWSVIGATVIVFGSSIYLMGFVKSEFFPNSTRPELIVDMTLPQGASLQATEQAVLKLNDHIKDHPNVVNFTSYVGKGAPRFVLVADPVLDASNVAQFVIVTKDLAARDQLQQEITELSRKDFENVRINTKVIALGPPSPYPVMMRVSGPDHAKVREMAEHVRTVMQENPYIYDVNFNWYEKNKVLRLQVDPQKARMLGIDKQQLAQSLQAQLSGMPVSEFREGDQKFAIIFRTDEPYRMDLSRMEQLNIYIGGGKTVPLGQIAKITYEAEDGLIWRYNLQPTITVQALILPGTTGNDATLQVYERLKEYRENLPAGYTVELAGGAEDSAKASKTLGSTIPMMIVVIMFLLMFQLQNMSKMVMVLLTAPLGLIGVSLSLLATGKPLGFVAQLGILALAGIIMRNSVILIDQIETLVHNGVSPWVAIIEATIMRFRPIMLTAAAAILAMVPLASSIFWGPMAVAIAGGLIVATVLTLIVLPAMYAALAKVKPNYDPKAHEDLPIV
ncbi:efflux RND transporter permease subunit [Heliophilum fasciatum]|uniref:Multidrug efflux pump subunit AcrB n=1 Tax=Heliophilum fasciatum TaxID=35700 RepID=A0A4R2RVN9_9FIRM|nr:efflux RND transporter permease subunit [Heliophilum fasciatum]MCW2276992.1 multidrug efflux pump subunit AcrB [Heliophilum fasciatum]TCP68482.1 multidrug efflux pump subunit AcrB [Heliophilum fasciatum]